MKYAPIGNTDIQVSRLSLGSWNVYSRLTFEAGVDLVRTAVDNGINFFDVAYYRNTPHTELIWSRLIRELGLKRSDYVLAEKLWYFDYPREPLMHQMDRMLRRVDEEFVDVIIVEHPRPGMSVEELATAAGEIVASGKARAWGVLNWTPDDLVEAHTLAVSGGFAAPEMAQLKYSIVRRNVVEGAYEPAFAQTGASLHASDSMEGGILAGILEPTRHIGIDVGGIRDDIRARVPRIVAAAEKLGITPAQFSLAWCLTNERVASLLFGATTTERLIENVAAVDFAEMHREAILEGAKGLGLDAHALDQPYTHDRPLIGDFVA